MSAPLLDLGEQPRDSLVPFLPRLTLQWLRDHPERRWIELEGTLVFVDISGFTALSERLSTLGKAGAEELTDVIDATFAPLLRAAYECGGSLLKFGGDALLLLFSGSGHAARAARAGADMRILLRTIGRIRTSTGAASLQMHVGIHSGRIHLFLVGETHRELLVTGPAATATVEMEAAAEVGEILISPATAGAIDPHSLGPSKEPGWLLESAPAVASELEPLPDPTGVALEQAVPSALRDQLLEVGPLEGEHRPAAVAFVRFQTLDALIEREGPENAAHTLDELVRVVQGAAEEYGVTFLQSDIDRDGGKLILVAGAPQTRGDNEERLLRTVRTIVDARPRLPLHVGVSRGRIFAGQVGLPFRSTYTVMGDTVALAARLMARANAGQIIVAAEAFERSRGQFDGEELEPFEVKGMSAPVRAFALGALRTAPEPMEHITALPFVGRERERTILSESASTVRAGSGMLVEIVGEPGIGKSRLADVLRGQCDDMVQVTVRCEQYESSTPYHPFRPILHSLLDVQLDGATDNRRMLGDRLAQVDEELVPWAPLLAAPLDVEVQSTPEVDDLDPAFWRARLHSLVDTLLTRLLNSPTLLIFEDVHWMDDASSELLGHLGTNVEARPWLVCTTRRPLGGGFTAEGEPALSALRVELEPLTDEEAELLVQAAAEGRRLGPKMARALAERGAGNPLFLQELAIAGAETDELPETIEALLATRIDRLGPGERILLRWASVLGVAFPRDLIAEILAEDSTLRFETNLSEFIQPDPDIPDGLRFRHALVRDVAYEGLSYRRRRDLHGRAGDAIERRASDPSEAAELLSLHFLRAARWSQAWQYSVEAGRRAWQKHANVEAAGFFERALEVVSRVPEVGKADAAEIWESLGDARMRLGEYEHAGTAFRLARKTFTDDPAERARLMQKEAIVPLRLAQHKRALRQLGRALRTLEEVDDSRARTQRARIFSTYGMVLQRERRPLEVIGWCERAVSEAEHADAQDALAQAYRMLDWAYVVLGRAHEAVYSERAAAIYEKLGDLDSLAWVLNNLGGFAFLEGRWNDALTYVGRAREAWERVGNLTLASVAAFNIGQTLSDQGRIEEAEPLLRDALEAQEASGNLLDIALTTSALGRLAARAGRFQEARALLEEAREMCIRDRHEVEVLTTDCRIAESLVLQGDGLALARVQETLRRAATIEGVSVQFAMLHRLRGWALMQEGMLEDANEALEESLRFARAGEANFGMESADYDAALTLDAFVQLGQLKSEAVSALERERDAITKRLGVVATPRPPLLQE
jgi:class 3 adenylate cyclase/tetratricopeptide (TPR) repeat protein